MQVVHPKQWLVEWVGDEGHFYWVEQLANTSMADDCQASYAHACRCSQVHKCASGGLVACKHVVAPHFMIAVPKVRAG